jgi:hypothetical protein
MSNNKQQTEINAVEYLSKVNQFAKENNTDKPKQQTAVEWLEKQIIKFHYWKRNPEFDEDCFDEIELHKSIQQAKEMEKERIIKAYNEDLYGGLSGHRKFNDGEEYYNETYGGNK